MPAATIEQACDEILDRLKAAIDASPYADITVIYEDSRRDQPRDSSPTPPAGKPYIVAGLRHSGGRQASLGGAVGARRRQEVSGIVFMQLFTVSGDGSVTARQVVEVLMNAYRTGGPTPSGVQFRSARFREIGKDGLWFRTNVLVDFEYDQFV